MIAAAKRRLLLAGYVDLLLFLTIAAAASWALQRVMGWTSSVAVAVGTFVVVEGVLMVVGRSPGLRVLGIARREGALAVLPPWSERERWWTMLVGALGLLSGSKEVTRWMQGLPPPPFMGLSLSWDAAAAMVTISGTLSIVAGLGVLATRTWAAALGCGLSVITTLSWIASWSQIPAWVEARTVARRAVQGLPVRDGEIATMQWILPGGALFAGVVGGLWLLAVFRRFRRLDQARGAGS